ncbi:YeeE/YedE family protein [Dictyoglomus thermophilum]|uniref:YeeE/YedE family protein n=1 Tax=Dictyoglomus thermophilum (strain ATCC 35947 / DSM 3960 / H-6-12) TaxID=309799 RepID=B5YCK8_DICT6|nr:YeeE/YedE family protein [Dictyoglomus thermophilum]ACI20064.1 YeeE/YedE family protein [Dictyoglomus thermophilum H-6-12]MCX7720131.1 YeeE/YedE family protein [Dictyoglomus thermophilum]TYT23401.1 YeeE/YedE family protein [Dictyoglomus thermophilum]
MIWQGLLVGILFGVVLQRSRMCFNSAIRDIKFNKDNYLVKMAAVAILIETLGFHLVASLGWIKLNPLPFIPLAQIIGGFLFGMGMVLAGGCASGVTYRIGEGYITAILAGLFYGITASAVRGGVLNFVNSWFGSPITVTMQDPGIYNAVEGKVSPTIANVLGINPWIVAIVFAVLLAIYIWGTKTTERQVSGLNWLTGGVALGIVGILGYLSQKSYALGITGGWVNLLRGTVSGVAYNWIGMEVLGIIIGAFVSALISKEFKLRVPKDPKTYLQVILGGILMGFGAGVAAGCNIGHILSGLPHLALSSILATIFFVLGNWFMFWYLYARK